MGWVLLFVVLAILFGLGTAVHIAANLLWLLVIVAAIIFVVSYISRPRR